MWSIFTIATVKHRTMSRQRPACVVCRQQASKYTCTSCRANYCSVACYKHHKETCATVISVPCVPDSTQIPAPAPLRGPPPVRPLTTLKWPYVPDTSAYPDPLTRDDPKPLQRHHYEAIATSSTIRTLLRTNPRLCDLLASIDGLRGAEREEALQHAVGVDSRLLKNDAGASTLDEDTSAFRELAEAIEVAVRGGKEDVLGLDWE